MDTHQLPPAKGTTHHPVMLLAALAVLLFSLVGTAAIMGWLPSSVGGNAANRPLTEADRLALANGMQQSALPPAVPAAQPYAAAPYPAQPAPQPYPGQAYAPAPGLAPAPAAPVVRESTVREPVRRTQVASSENSSKWCSNCGNIESIRKVTQRAEGSGLGAAGGAVLGGLLGNQVGGGSGRQLATVAGAVGGAVVGNQIEGNMKATHSYEIRVRLDDGSLRTFHQGSAPGWRTGERVKIVKGSLRRA